MLASGLHSSESASNNRANRCPEDYQGKAYVSEQVWDISSLQACEMGSTCPVSNTFTDTRFAVPRGCHAVTTNVVKNDVRGQIEVQEPSALSALVFISPVHSVDAVVRKTLH